LTGLAKIQSSVPENSESCFHDFRRSNNSPARSKVFATLPSSQRLQPVPRCRAGCRAASRANPRQPTGAQEPTDTKAQAHTEQGHSIEWLMQLFSRALNCSAVRLRALRTLPVAPLFCTREIGLRPGCLERVPLPIAAFDSRRQPHRFRRNAGWLRGSFANHAARWGDRPRLEHELRSRTLPPKRERIRATPTYGGF